MPAERRRVIRKIVLSFVKSMLVALATPAMVAWATIMPPAAAQSPSPGVTVPADVLTARTGASRVDAVEAELVADVRRAIPGEPFRIGLRLRHDPLWHTYWRNPGDSGLPTRFDPAGPAGASYGDIVWPAPKRLAVGDLANYGYEGEVVLSRQVALPSSFDEPAARFDVLAQWLVCKDVCIPGQAALALDVPVAPRGQSSASGGEPLASAAAASFESSARRAPDPAARMQSGWWQQGTQAYLVLPEGLNANRAEFFPYFEGVVTPAAPQPLVQLQAPEGSRRHGQALRLATQQGRALPEPAAGLLLADGKAIEIGLIPLAAAPEAGKVISVAEAAPAAPSSAPGLLDRLRGAGAATSAPGAAVPAAPAFPAGSADGASAQALPGSSATTPRAGLSATLAVAVAAALLGGLILNLMPCVFPVIGLKVLSFSQAAVGDSSAARRHALTFSAGVVVTFLMMGLVLLALRSAGAAVGWGFQMQSPVFVGAMVLLFVLIGLNLFGVFETGVALSGLEPRRRSSRRAAVASTSDVGNARAAAQTFAGGQSFPGRQSFASSFAGGVIAVIVATPCAAPFMGSAIGFTLSAEPGQTLAVFAALGIGMAAPYLVLGSAPRLLRWLPRPGPWLPAFRQFLAFPMLATAAWLTWVLTLQTGAEGLLRVLMAAILVAFAAWIHGRAQATRFAGHGIAGFSGLSGLTAFTAALLAGLATIWQLAQISDLQPAPDGAGGPYASRTAAEPAPAALTDSGQSGRASSAVDLKWQPWSAQRVTEALRQGRPVLVDFTAAWCISCQVNKKLVLERDVLRRAFDEARVALLRADWTSRDPEITAELARFGRNGVPMYLVYASAREPPRLLPELLTVDTVLEAIGAGR